MRKKVITLVLCSLFVIGCIDDEIEIGMISNKDQPIFNFKFVRKPKKPVELTSVMIREANTEQVVWAISSIDPWQFYEKKGDRFYPKKDGVSSDQIKAVNLDRLIFGIVPDGLKQYYPPSSAHPLSEDARLKKYYPPTDEEKPMLKTNTRYIISAGSGAGSGSLEFTIDRECRKISLTPYSKNNPSFLKENKCD